MSDDTNVSRQVIWMNRIAAGAISGVVSVFVAGVLALAWGDNRYVRRTEFEQHSSDQKSLEMHAAEDAKKFVTREEFAVTQAAAATTAAEIARVNEQLAALRTDVGWIKAEVTTHRK